MKLLRLNDSMHVGRVGELSISVTRVNPRFNWSVRFQAPGDRADDAWVTEAGATLTEAQRKLTAVLADPVKYGMPDRHRKALGR